VGGFLSQLVQKNVLFLLLNGEAFDYLGSQRVVYDMIHNEFPYKEASLNLDDVGLLIELSQLRNDDLLTYHTYQNISRSTVPLIHQFDKLFKEKEKAFKFPSSGLKEKPSDSRFPPSSYQSF
jgi:nicastrin